MRQKTAYELDFPTMSREEYDRRWAERLALLDDPEYRKEDNRKQLQRSLFHEAERLELIDQTWTPKTNNSDGYDRPIPSDEINSVRQKLNILAVELRRIVTLLD